MSFLDIHVCSDFRDAVNSTNIFACDEQYKHSDYNFICAVMDRVDTCVEYLNIHSQTPKSDEEFIVFLMFASMLIDAVKETFRQLKVEYPYLEKKNKNISFENDPLYYTYFRDVCLSSELKITEENCPTDDKFFEYFRSLSFAHPVETSRAKFLQNGETQYAPHVLVNNPVLRLCGSDDFVGIRIYSNKSDSIFDVAFSFDIFTKYVASRYNLLKDITEKILEIIKHHKQLWEKRKVNRKLSTTEILEDIYDILQERHEYDMVGNIISYLTCKLSNDDNSKSVEIFRKALINLVPSLCDAIDDMDYYEAHKIVEIAQIRPKVTYHGFGYNMEKIFLYLYNECGKSEVEWGLQMADEFSQQFAKKWVTIDPHTMSFAEIRLLVRTACYREWLEQEEQQ